MRGRVCTGGYARCVRPAVLQVKIFFLTETFFISPVNAIYFMFNQCVISILVY